jgi:hypothetical protein
MTSFLADCTASYCNNEGQGPSPHSLPVAYSAGAPTYFYCIEPWRNSGEFERIDFSPRG